MEVDEFFAPSCKVSPVSVKSKQTRCSQVGNGDVGEWGRSTDLTPKFPMLGNSSAGCASHLRIAFRQCAASVQLYHSPQHHQEDEGAAEKVHGSIDPRRVKKGKSDQPARILAAVTRLIAAGHHRFLMGTIRNHGHDCINESEHENKEDGDGSCHNFKFQGRADFNNLSLGPERKGTFDCGVDSRG